LYSFYNSDKGEWAVGSIINPKENSGIYFLSTTIDKVSIDEYISKATGRNIWDYKITDGRYIVLRYDIYRGVPISSGLNGLPVFASARDVGNIAAGIVSGVHGIPWIISRLAFDFYQSYQEYKKNGQVRFVREGVSTRTAQRYGWEQGHSIFESSVENNKIRRSK
jgi:hypothetical protein